MFEITDIKNNKNSDVVPLFLLFSHYNIFFPAKTCDKIIVLSCSISNIPDCEWCLNNHGWNTVILING